MGLVSENSIKKLFSVNPSEWLLGSFLFFYLILVLAIERSSYFNLSLFISAIEIIFLLLTVKFYKHQYFLIYQHRPIRFFVTFWLIFSMILIVKSYFEHSPQRSIDFISTAIHSFFYPAIAIFFTNRKLLFLSKSQTYYILLLCIISIPFATGRDPVANASNIFKIELIIIVTISLSFKSIPFPREATFYLFLIASSASLVFSPLQNYLQSIGLFRHYEIIMHLVTLIFLGNFFSTLSHIQIERILKSISISISILLAFLIIFILVNPYNYDITKPFKLPLNSNIRHTGFLFLISLSILIPFTFEKSSKKIWLVFYIPLLSFLITLNGRASFIALFIAFITYYIISLKFKKTVSIFKIATAWISSYLIAQIYKIDNDVFNRLNFSDSTNISSIQIRMDMYIDTFNHFLDRISIGYGPNAFALLQDTIEHYHPHNFLLQFLLEWGAIGTTLIILYFIIILFNPKIISKKIYTNYLSIFASYLGIITLLINSLFSGSLYFGQPVFYFILLSSIIYSNSLIKNEKL